MSDDFGDTSPRVSQFFVSDEVSSDPETSTSSMNDSDECTTSDSDELDEGGKVDESLSSTILKEIQEGTYICLVCTGEIDRSCKIWSCNECFRVYDLDCIRSWAIRGSSTDKAKKEWRCPSCNTTINKIPSRFSCWCGRVTNPDGNGDFPFSCGEPCSYNYGNCIHSCSSVCHPGNHPTCGAMGPMMNCKCGSEQRQLPCLITPYRDGWTCEKECNIMLCDRGHKCDKGCHSGFCGLCERDVETRCYCGKEKIKQKCHELIPKDCNEWIGGGSCSNMSKIYYDCGIHFESVTCRPLSKSKGLCKFSTSVVDTCYCGKTKVDGSYRTKCTDKILECDQICGKTLGCGCKCLMKCHEGECECHNILDINCACGNYSYSVPCKFIQQGFKPKCSHKCPVLLHCRKHYHKKICCEYEKAALTREKHKKKAIRNNMRSNFEDELMSIEPVHICTRQCNRLKSCGIHTCDALCHPGSCGVCLESTDDDLVCHCGKTIIRAPVRCGTILQCHEQCNRPKDCGHPAQPHECHDDAVNCPKCTYGVTKACSCGLRNDVPNVICSQTKVSCGMSCKSIIECGHPCSRVCSSSCTKEGIHASPTTCENSCRKRRSTCPHLCTLRCHSFKAGKSKKCDIITCKEPVQISCSCGYLTKSVPCGASTSSPSSIGKDLECNEECAKFQRSQQLKQAFAISNDDEYVKGPYSQKVLSIYEKQYTWCSRVEDVIRKFVREFQISSGDARKSYYFGPLNKGQRLFIHELSKSFMLYSESQDREPNRTIALVIVDKTILPELTIDDAIFLKRKGDQANIESSESGKKFDKEILFNAILIDDLFFGVFREDIEIALRGITESHKLVNPKLQWMSEGTFVLFSASNYQAVTIEEENVLFLIMKTSRKVLRESSLAFGCKLCVIDDDANYVLRVEGKVPMKKDPASYENASVEKSTHRLGKATSFNFFETLQDDTE